MSQPANAHGCEGLKKFILNPKSFDSIAKGMKRKKVYHSSAPKLRVFNTQSCKGIYFHVSRKPQGGEVEGMSTYVWSLHLWSGAAVVLDLIREQLCPAANST